MPTCPKVLFLYLLLQQQDFVLTELKFVVIMVMMLIDWRTAVIVEYLYYFVDHRYLIISAYADLIFAHYWMVALLLYWIFLTAVAGLVRFFPLFHLVQDILL